MQWMKDTKVIAHVLNREDRRECKPAEQYALQHPQRIARQMEDWLTP